MPRSGALALWDGSNHGPVVPAAINGVLGFLRLIWALDHGLHLVSRRMEAERGVTGPQRLLIRLLGERPGLSPGQLAALLHLDPSTVTGIVRRLEKKRLVKRTADPNDGRRVIVALTERSRGVNTPDPHTVEALVERALARFPRTKIGATEEVLRALAQVLAPEVEDRPEDRPKDRPKDRPLARRRETASHPRR